MNVLPNGKLIRRGAAPAPARINFKLLFAVDWRHFSLISPWAGACLAFFPPMLEKWSNLISRVAWCTSLFQFFHAASFFDCDLFSSWHTKTFLCATVCARSHNIYTVCRFSNNRHYASERDADDCLCVDVLLWDSDQISRCWKLCVAARLTDDWKEHILRTELKELFNVNEGIDLLHTCL